MPKSDLHKTVLNLAKKCYPGEKIREEEAIKIGNHTLFLDIFFPRLKLAIECDGQQHFAFSKFFHSDAMSFNRQKKNDKIKEEYCNENKITLVRIKYNDQMTVEFLSQKILEAFKKTED